MERVLKPYDKEYMRLAMLKHEETFKEQVYELHRLYRIQKLMMRSIGKTNKNHHQIPSNKHQELWNNGFSFNSRSNNVTNIVVAPPPSNHLHHHHHHHDKLAVKLDLERRPAAEEFAESNGDHVEEEERNGTVVMEECEIELTLGPASYCSRRKKLCQEETALTSESGGGSLSSSSTGSSRINRRSNKLGSSRVDDPENGMMKMKKQKQNSNVDNNEQLTRQQQQDSRLKQQQPPWQQQQDCRCNFHFVYLIWIYRKVI